MKDYQRALVDARMGVIPRAIHTHHIEQLEIYKTMMRGFLDSMDHSITAK